MNIEQTAKDIMEIVHNSWDSALMEKSIIEGMRAAYRDGFKDGAQDARSRDFASRHGHDMGQ